MEAIIGVTVCIGIVLVFTVLFSTLISYTFLKDAIYRQKEEIERQRENLKYATERLEESYKIINKNLNEIIQNRYNDTDKLKHMENVLSEIKKENHEIYIKSTYKI